MVDGVSKTTGTQRTQKNIEPFEKFAKRLNATIPDRTSNISDKNRAIDVKKQLLAHPDCPLDAKAKLQEEIATIEGEIARMQNMNSSIFDNKTEKAE